MKRLSIIVITWNEISVLKRCLISLCREFDFDNDEIIVVDNGSSDGTASCVKHEFPRVRLLALPENIGVGPARNRGIVFASGKFCMTLDNDTILEDPIRGEEVESFFRSNPNAGVFGYMLYNVDGTYQGNARRFPGWLQPLAARFGPVRRFRWAERLLNRHLMTDLEPDKVKHFVEVDYVLGANQVFTKELAAMLNCYDESIFFGPEDFDFCLRSKKLGRENFLVRGPRIIHDYRRRTRKFSLITVRHIVSYYRIMLKHRATWA